MKPRRPQGRNLLGAPLNVWRVAKRQCAWLLTRRPSVRIRPRQPHRCARIAQPAERRSYKAEALGSIPSACTTHATLAQLEQSAGLRCRRSKVQLLHVAPHHAALAQWIRVPGFDPGGRRFDSCTPRHCSHRLTGQDISLSQRKLGFESRREHQLDRWWR